MISVKDQLIRIERHIQENSWHTAIAEAHELYLRHNLALRTELNALNLLMPDVLLIGPARTATTWLRGVLGKHPNIRVALGEPNLLFNMENGRIYSTLSLYAQPNIWRNLDGSREVCCEKSPSYICLSDNVIKLIAAMFPNTKIVIGIRDEERRLWSVIHHRMNDLQFSGNWVDFCRKHPDEISHHLNAGHVEYHLDRWRSAFLQQNVLALNFDIITASPRVAVDTVLQHIGMRKIAMLGKNERAGIERRILEVEKQKNLNPHPSGLISKIVRIIDQV